MLNKEMTKKTHIKVRLVPEAKPDSPFFYYVKKPAGGEKAKVKLKAKNIIPRLESTKFLQKKNFLTQQIIIFLKFLLSKSI